MPIIAELGHKTCRGRTAILTVYSLLIALGTTMAVPFLITLSGSVSNEYDYERFLPLPRYFWSQSDRFVKGLVAYFDRYPDWHLQMRCRFPEMPTYWSAWQSIGSDIPGVDRLAADYLHPSAETLRRWQVMAADYVEFVDQYPLGDSVAALSDEEVGGFLLQRYETLWAQRHPVEARRAGAAERREQAVQLLGETWGSPIPNLFTVSFENSESRLPLWQQSWYPPTHPKYADFKMLKAAYRDHSFDPNIRDEWQTYLRAHPSIRAGTTAVYPATTNSAAELQAAWTRFKQTVVPATRTVPFALRAVWRKYLESEEVHELAGLARNREFDVQTYNRLAGTHYRTLYETPFPLPADTAPKMQAVWRDFVVTRYPIRLTSIAVTPERIAQFQEFLRTRFKSLPNARRVLVTSASQWSDFVLTPAAPEGEENHSLRSVWIDFVKTLPAEERILTSSEHVYQQFLLQKYGSLARINELYGAHRERIEEAFPPFNIAYALTFRHNEDNFFWSALRRNYTEVLKFLTSRGNAVLVTLLLVALAILATLTINPLAAYGLSRFNLKGKDKILMYLLATMAFPAMVSAIPAYLLIRDLGLLNTFFALVLPGAANGMVIFILKGFFDSLPPELYDAATIDGANEWQIFTRITLPMMKPILAINVLTAFLWAYNSWEWALIICQRENMWTLAVWLFQANSQWWVDKPWITAAGFVVVSIPTLLIFLFCQKIILRGIILPSMK